MGLPGAIECLQDVEPALIVGMGVVIGGMLVSLYPPIFSLATAAR